MPITRLLNQELVQKTIDEALQGYLPQWDKIYPKLAKVQSADQYQVIKNVYNELDRFHSVDELNAGDEDDYKKIGQATFTTVDYLKNVIITKQLLRDNNYTNVFNELTNKGKSVVVSSVNSREEDVANIFNRAFNSSYTGGYSGEILCSNSHTATAGSQSNILATAQDLDISALEDAYTVMLSMQNDIGDPIRLKPRYLLVHPSEYINALTIIKSQLKPGTANNDINTLSNFGIEVIANPWLTDTDAWFLLAEDPMGKGIVFYEREGLNIWKNEKQDNLSYKIVYHQAYMLGWIDWRYVVGTPGAV